MEGSFKLVAAADVLRVIDQLGDALIKLGKVGRSGS